MNNIKRNYLIRIIIAGIIGGVSYVVGLRYPSTYFYTTMTITPFAVLYIIYAIFKLLYKLATFQRLFKKLLKYVTPALQRFKKIWVNVTTAIFKWLGTTSVYEKIEFLKFKNNNRITGYSDTIIRNRNLDPDAEYELYKLKWKRCRNNAERVRFLYAKYVTQGRKQKQPFSYADTPSEVQKNWGETEHSKLLIPAYYEARYSEEADVSEEVVERLQRE